jgi:hypothetical protein
MVLPMKGTQWKTSGGSEPLRRTGSSCDRTLRTMARAKVAPATMDTASQIGLSPRCTETASVTVAKIPIVSLLRFEGEDQVALLGGFDFGNYYCCP